MDRTDEYNRDERDVEHVKSRDERVGDILGLGGGPEPTAPADPSADHDPEGVAKRRDRVRIADNEGPDVGFTGIHSQADRD